MATYSELLDDVLVMTETQGVTDVIALVKIALPRCVRYISRRVDLSQLIQTSTYTWASGTTQASLGVDFAVTDYQTPYLLLVGETPYNYLEFKDWLVLKFKPGGWREGLDAPTRDLRYEFSFTIDLDDNIILYPIPVDQVVTLYYFSSVAAYADAGVPEIPSDWTDILIDGACLVVKTYIENPSAPVNFDSIFKNLDTTIDQYKTARAGRFLRDFVRLKSNYNMGRK